MAQYSKRAMASAIALAFGLAACGGGGGGSGLVSTPPPPPPPPVPPPPPPVQGTVGAAAMATVPNANLFPPAVDGGPTLQQHPTTRFPLLQSVVTITGSTLAADTSVMNGGATLTFDSTPPSNEHNYKLSVPALGLSDLALVAGGFYCYAPFCGYQSNLSIELEIADPATSNLNWTTYGTWAAFGSSAFTRGMFVTGYDTPAAAVPTTGTATYNGSVAGRVFQPAQGISSESIAGLAALQANFGSGSISGNLTNMTAGGLPWNSVSLSGSIAGGQNSFSGSSAATSAPGGPWALTGSASGTFAGRFFGPGAQELGAIWTLHDGRATALGSIAAKRGQ